MNNKTHTPDEVEALVEHDGGNTVEDALAKAAATISYLLLGNLTREDEHILLENVLGIIPEDIAHNGIVSLASVLSLSGL